MIPVMLIDLVHPDTSHPFPFAIVGSRRCFAVPAGARFAVLVSEFCYPFSRHEVVVAVDGRDTLSNRPAAETEPGIVVSGSRYLCKGFRISSTEVREFVCSEIGRGATVAERNGSTSCAGLVAAAAYTEAPRRSLLRGAAVETFGPAGVATRGGGSVGAAAGDAVRDVVGETSWVRGSGMEVLVVEYDTFAGWAASGVVIPALNDSNPWPGARPAFADPHSL